MDHCSTTPANRPLATLDTYGLVEHDLSPTPELATSPTRCPTHAITGSSSSPSLATSEADPNVSYCVLCDKSYTGPNARSILRRHKSEKHGIALSEQRKGTRWDKDPNRPRSEAERRERTLESKRRYAQRRRRQLQEAQDALKAVPNGIDMIRDADPDPFAHEDSLISRAKMFTDTTTPIKNERFLPSIHQHQDTPAAPLAPITNVKPPTTPKKSKTDLYKLLNSPLPVTPDSSPIHQLHLPKLPFLSSSPGQENNIMMMPRLRSSSRNSPRNNSLGRKAPPSSPLAGFNPYPSRQPRDTVDAAAWSLLALHKTSEE